MLWEKLHSCKHMAISMKKIQAHIIWSPIFFLVFGFSAQHFPKQYIKKMEIGNPSKLPFRFAVLHLPPPPKKNWGTFTPEKYQVAKHVSNQQRQRRDPPASMATSSNSGRCSTEMGATWGASAGLVTSRRTVVNPTKAEYDRLFKDCVPDFRRCWLVFRFST